MLRLTRVSGPPPLGLRSALAVRYHIYKAKPLRLEQPDFQKMLQGLHAVYTSKLG
jgi:hypothetical protein